MLFPVSTQEVTVPPRLEGARLDKAAQELFTGLSRAQVKRAILDGSLRVGGRRRPKGATVASGEVLSLVTPAAADGGGAVPTPDAPLLVRFESPLAIVVDKPAGQATAPLRAGEVGTLANALVGRYPELAGIGHGPREPGLVHRLDTGTSGLLLAARTAEAFAALSGALKEGRIKKEYLLVCLSEGLADAGVIEFPIAKHPKDQRRVYPCVHPRDVMRYAPRPASTPYEVVRRTGRWALVKVAIGRALRHQIRAHFAAIEHPLAGDALYGDDAVPGLGRHALHASRIAFDGPEAGLRFDVASPLPDSLAALLA